MKKHAFILVVLIVVLSTQGCLFNKVSCKILSVTIIDDGGFPSILVNLNASAPVFIKLFKDGNLLDEKELYVPGRQNLKLCMAGYHEIPEGGKYVIKVYDDENNLVCKKEIDVENPHVQVNDPRISWWREGKKYVLLEISLNITNLGILPFYVDSMLVSVDGTINKTAFVYNKTVSPLSKATITACPCIGNIPEGVHSINIKLFSIDGTRLFDFSFTNSTHFDLYEEKFSKSWAFKGRRYTLTFPIPKKMLSFYSPLKRTLIEDYSCYILSPEDDNYISFLSSKLLSLSREKNQEGIVNFVVSFVQSITYQKEVGEYPQYPVETLAYKKGDCEDKAILASSILMDMGLDVSLLRFPEHMAVGVHLENADYEGKVFYEDPSGKKYLFLETSMSGWELGEASEEYKDSKDFSIYHVKPKPIVLQNCNPPVRYKDPKSDFIVIEDRIVNLGTLEAKNVQLFVEFLTDFDFPVKEYKSETFYVKQRSEKQIRLKVESPRASFSKVRVDVYFNGSKCHSSLFLFN